MSEAEWLVCTNPHAMYGSLTSNLKWIADKANWILSENKCDLLRCVVGNPFRPIGFTKNKCKRCNGRGYEDVSKEPCSTAIMDCLRCDGTGNIGILLDSALLTWNDGTIPRLAQGIIDSAKCPAECSKVAGLIGCRVYERSGPESRWAVCRQCNGTGHNTLDPVQMLVLADAVDEAHGPQQIVEHLREHKRVCDAIGKHHGDKCSGGRIQSPNAQFTQDCPSCNGTGQQPRLHVTQCHAVAMWLGEKP